MLAEILGAQTHLSRAKTCADSAPLHSFASLVKMQGELQPRQRHKCPAYCRMLHQRANVVRGQSHGRGQRSDRVTADLNWLRRMLRCDPHVIALEVAVKAAHCE